MKTRIVHLTGLLAFPFNIFHEYSGRALRNDCVVMLLLLLLFCLFIHDIPTSEPSIRCFRILYCNTHRHEQPSITEISLYFPFLSHGTQVFSFFHFLIFFLPILCSLCWYFHKLDSILLSIECVYYLHIVEIMPLAPSSPCLQLMSFSGEYAVSNCAFDFQFLFELMTVFH